MYIPSGSVYLIAELFGLILVLNLVYVAVFIGIERTRLIKGKADQAIPSGGTRNAARYE